MSNTLRWIVSVVAVVFMTSAIAFGQSTFGSLEGTVKDSTGGVIPGATVTVTGVNVGFNQTVTTNSNGVYRLERIPTGRFKVAVAPISGFAETTVDAQVVIEKTSTVDVTMGVSTDVIDITVSDDPLGVVVDATDSKIQSNITSELIDKLPSGTSFSSILRVNPATRGEDLTGGFQVDGASKAENAFILDGQEVTSYRYGTLDSVNNVPTALIKEVQIKVSGFEAEHGGASGGVITISSKTGSNDLHGEFGAQFSSSAWQPANRFTPGNYANVTLTPDGSTVDHATQIPYHLQQPKDKTLDFFPTASLGGPIIKDHLWFYGIYSPQIFTRDRNVNYICPIGSSYGPACTSVDEENHPIGDFTIRPNPDYASEVYTGKSRYEYAQGRLDYSILNNLTGFTSYLWNPGVFQGSFPNSALSQSSPGEQAYYSETGAALAALKGGRVNSNVFNTSLTWNPLSNLVINGRFGYGFQNDHGSSYAPNALPRILCQGTASHWSYGDGSNLCPFYGWQSSPSDSGATFAEVSKRKTFNIDASVLFNGLGRHMLKGGFEYARLSSLIDAAPLERYYHRPGNISASVHQLLNGYCQVNECSGYGINLRYGEGGQAHNNVKVLYLQDKWQIGRLALNLGIRAENENLPAFNTDYEGSIAIPIEIPWGRKVVPRLGASYDLFGNGKTRIFASYGWFTDRMKFELPIGSFGGAFYTQSYYPLLGDHPEYTYYTEQTVFGNWNFPIGGGNPSTAGGLAQTQIDYRIPSNLNADDYEALVGFPIVGVDPDLQPFKQEEFTVGFETELSSNWVLSGRYTRKNLMNTLEDIGYVDNAENEYYTIGNPGMGVAQAQREAMGITKSVKARRLYNAMELTINRRFANNWYLSANYTLSSLKGNTSGLANSDYWDGGCADGSCADRASPGVNRFFDWATSGFTIQGTEDYGPLGTDRPHVFKAYGGYTWDWWGSKANATDISFFTTAMSGTPQTSIVNIGVATIYTERGDLGRAPMLTSTDLTLTHSYKFGRDNKYKLTGEITASNVFNENNVTALNPNRWLLNSIDIRSLLPDDFESQNSFDELVYIQNAINNGDAAPLVESLLNTAANRNASLGQPSAYQAKRNIRIGFRFTF